MYNGKKRKLKTKEDHPLDVLADLEKYFNFQINTRRKENENLNIAKY